MLSALAASTSSNAAYERKRDYRHQLDRFEEWRQTLDPGFIFGASVDNGPLQFCFVDSDGFLSPVDEPQGSWMQERADACSPARRLNNGETILYSVPVEIQAECVARFGPGL